MTDCCDDYGKCTQSYGCPVRPVDAWTKANIKGDFEMPIEMFEPSGFLTTMEWLRGTVAPCLVSVVLGGFIVAVYFLTRG